MSSRSGSNPRFLDLTFVQYPIESEREADLSVPTTLNRRWYDTKTMEEVFTEDGPEFDLPFSQAIKHGDTVYVSGQVPVDPDTLDIVGETVAEQTHRTMQNAAIILEAAGTSLDNVVKVTAFLDDIDDFDEFNEAYWEHVSEPYPARSAFEVSDLAIDIDIEIEVIAAL